MDSLGDSDSSEGMRELIERGFAIKSGRGHLSPDLDYPGTSRAPVCDTDVSHVQRPLTCNMLAGVASTHGLTLSTNEPVTAAGRYNITGNYERIFTKFLAISLRSRR